MTSRISIVIPCYNDELWIAEAIESCFAQTLPPLEVIVVDDGSQDGSRKILKSYEDKIKLIETSHQGGCAARNIGWRESKGDWVQFLDADDLLFPSKLEMHYAQSSVAPPHEIIYCSMLAVSAITGEFMYETSHPQNASIFERLLFEPITPLMPLFSRKSLEEVNGFTVNLPCLQDKDLNFRLWEKGYTFTPLAQTLIKSRRRPGSVSSNTIRCLLQYPNIYKSIIDGSSPRQNEIDFMSVAKLFTHASRHLAAAGLFKKSRIYHKIAKTLSIDGVRSEYGCATRTLLLLGGPILANIPLFFKKQLKRLKYEN